MKQDTSIHCHGKNLPLIHEGIDCPVRKPTQSFVKELQLKAAISREVAWFIYSDIGIPNR